MSEVQITGQVAIPILGVDYWAVQRIMGEPPTVVAVTVANIEADGGVVLRGVKTQKVLDGAFRLYDDVGVALHQCHMELARDLENLAGTMGQYAKEALELARTYDALIVAEPPKVVRSMAEAQAVSH